MSEVSLDALLSQGKDLNEVDRFLINTARRDDNATVLNKRDFVGAITEADQEGFIRAAKRYLDQRISRGGENDEIKTEFREALVRLRSLTADYRPDSVQSTAPNPFRLAPILRGRGTFFLVGGRTFTSATIQDKSGYEWQIWERALGLELTFPLEIVDHLYFGLLSMVSKPTGELVNDGTKMGKVSGTHFFLGGVFDYNRQPLRWLRLHAIAGLGYDGGRYDLSRTEAGRKAIADPCDFEITMVPTDTEMAGETVDDAGKAFTCRVKKDLGGFDTFAYYAGLGAEFRDAIDIRVIYRRSDLDSSQEEFTPDPRNDVLLLLGIRMF